MADVSNTNSPAITNPPTNNTCNPPSAGFEPAFQLADLIIQPTSHWHVYGWLISGVFVIVIWFLAFRTIGKHLWYYIEADTQRHKVRVLLYPPVFATCSWLSYYKYHYQTTIMFFAALFASFAVFNLYVLLQSYLQEFRDKNEGVKQPCSFKLFGFVPINIKSKWGLHYRVITDVCVFQFPIWNVLCAVLSIITEVKGVYCPESMTPKGFHVYTVILNFFSLTLILTALFIYLFTYDSEWKQAKVHAHAMFWSVKGPIMAIFWMNDVVLSLLQSFNVIKGTIYWSAANVKNGYAACFVCVVMLIDIIIMPGFYGPPPREEGIQAPGPLDAFADALLFFLPEFMQRLLFCGRDSYVLVQKRKSMKLRKVETGPIPEPEEKWGV